MARPGLTTHRKFRRLARALGSPLIARGALELLWESCYECGNDYVGTAGDLEALVGWDGTPGTLAQALVDAGAPEGHGFIEPVQADASGCTTYKVHDLWHHAPDYVAKRRKREMERQKRVAPSVKRRRTAPNGGHCPPSRDRQTGVDRTPSPSPAPSPAPSPGGIAPPPAVPDVGGRPRALTGSGVMAGTLPRDHARHAWCGRVCVPDFLHTDFERALALPDGDAQLRAFYAEICDQLSPGVAPEPVKFWRAHAAARWPAGTTSGTTCGREPLGNG